MATAPWETRRNTLSDPHLPPAGPITELWDVSTDFGFFSIIMVSRVPPLQYTPSGWVRDNSGLYGGSSDALGKERRRDSGREDTTH